MSTPPPLSISLVNTNNRELLRACLRSLLEQDHGVDFETILVDNVSTDGSVQMVRAEFPDVRLIENQNRKGFAANHNQAMRVARGKFILVLNEDTIIKPNALRAMVEYLDKHPKTAAVGPRLENPDGSLQTSCYKFPTPARAVMENLLLTAAFPRHRVIGDYRKWSHDRVREVDYVIGAALMIRREILDSVGYLDDGFFIYSEETDWQLRMRRAGWEIAFVPGGTIVHYGGQSSVAIKERQFCEFNRSAARYYRKHFGARGLAVQRSAMIFGALLRIALWGALGVLPARREKAKSNVAEWKRLLKWWLGLGPHEGIAELAQAPVKQ